MTSTSLYTTPPVAGTINRHSTGKGNDNYNNSFPDNNNKLPVLESKTNEGYKGAPSPSPNLTEKKSQQEEPFKFNAFYNRSNTNNTAGNSSSNPNYNNNCNNNVHANEFRFNKRGGINEAGVHNGSLDNYSNNTNEFNRCNTVASPARSEHKLMTGERLQKMENCVSRSNNNNGINPSDQVQTRREGYVTSANMQIRLPEQGIHVNTPNRQREKMIHEFNKQAMAVQLTSPRTSNNTNENMNTANDYNRNVVPQINHVSHSPTAVSSPRNATPFVRSHVVMNSDANTNQGEHSREVSTSLPKLEPQNRTGNSNYGKRSCSEEHRGNGNYNKSSGRVRPVDRGPQPMCVTPTRLPDGRRVVTEPRRMSLFGRKSVTILDTNHCENNVHKPNNIEKKKPENLNDTSQPKLKPLPGRRPPRNLTKRKQIKLTIGNDDSWMKGLTNSTWITSPVEGRPLAVPYKRVPNKKRSQKRHKGNESRATREGCQGNAALHDTNNNNSERGKETIWQRLRDMFNEKSA